MWRLVAYLLAVVGLAIGLSWLADRPGSLVINWQGYEIETSVFRAIVLLTFLVGLAIVAFQIARNIWKSPATIGHYFTRRRHKKGLDALSSGMIAIGAGDRALATRYAVQARKTLPNEPMTHLLRAQAAQLSGDRATARRIFEAMLGTPDTEQLGLRGLFLEAEREGETEAARQFAERAVALNPKLGWPIDSLFDIQCRQADWPGALDTLALAKKHGHVDKAVADRRRAVLLTAQAQAAEDSDPERAMNLALEGHSLAHDLVPAAAIAGRLLAARGNTPKAARVLQRAWKRVQHPELATAYAYARLGDSPRDRLERVRQLAQASPMAPESAIAVATTAIEAREWDAARLALEPLLESRLTQRVCTLMAKIEGEQHGDTGRVREWLARAVNAPRDPAWTADGIVSDVWAPVSPVSGQLDAFQWKVPVESLEKSDDARIAARLEELVALGTRPEAKLSPPADAAAPEVARPPAVERGKAVDADVVAEVQPVKEAAVPVEAQPAAKPAPSAHAAPVAPRNGTPKPQQQPAKAALAAAQPEKPVPAKPVQQPKSEPAAKAAPPPAPARSAEPAPIVVKPLAAAATVKSSAGTTRPTGDQKSGDRTAPSGKPKVEPHIFISPRAPDDPGPDAVEAAEEMRSPLMPTRKVVK